MSRARACAVTAPVRQIFHIITARTRAPHPPPPAPHPHSPPRLTTSHPIHPVPLPTPTPREKEKKEKKSVLFRKDTCSIVFHDPHVSHKSGATSGTRDGTRMACRLGHNSDKSYNHQKTKLRDCKAIFIAPEKLSSNSAEVTVTSFPPVQLSP